jgi:hypothetical protein
MHRSGTSALTGALARSGVALGGRLLPADEHNPKGYFENDEIVSLHRSILLALGTNYDDFWPLPGDAWERPAILEKQRELARIVAKDLAGEALSGVKDPRLCRLFPLWKPVLAEAGLEPCVVLCVRSPVATLASLVRREGFAPNKGLLLWLSHVADSERHTRGMRRLVVEYDALLADPPGTLARIASGHGIVWPRSRDLEGFLEPGLRHHGPETKIGELDSRLISLADRFFAALVAAARSGETFDLAVLDREWLDLVPAYEGWRDCFETEYARRLREVEAKVEAVEAEFRSYRETVETSLAMRTREAYWRWFPPGTRRHRVLHAIGRALARGKS